MRETENKSFATAFLNPFKPHWVSEIPVVINRPTINVKKPLPKRR